MHAVIIFEDNEYRAKVIEGRELGPFKALDEIELLSRHRFEGDKCDKI